jgi:hypothetical protein
MWFIKGYIDGFQGIRVGGGVGDVAVAGNYCAGPFITDAAVWNQFSAVWNILSFPPRTITWGHTNDIPVPADYDGDRTTDFATFQTGFWYIQYYFGGESNYIFGGPGDVPVPRDFDGDVIADRTVFRPWTSEWWIAKSSDNTLQREVFGGPGDIAVPSK